MVFTEARVPMLPRDKARLASSLSWVHRELATTLPDFHTFILTLDTPLFDTAAQPLWLGKAFDEQGHIDYANDAI